MNFRSLCFLFVCACRFSGDVCAQFGAVEFEGGIDHALLGEEAYPLAPVHMESGKIYEVISGSVDRVAVRGADGKNRIVRQPKLSLAKGERFANGRVLVTSGSVEPFKARGWKSRESTGFYIGGASTLGTEVKFSLLASEDYQKVTLGILFFNDVGGGELFLKSIGSLLELEEQQVSFSLPFAYDMENGPVRYMVLLFSPEGEIVTDSRREMTPLLNSIFEGFYTRLIDSYAESSDGASKPVSLVQQYPILTEPAIFDEEIVGDTVSFLLEIDRRGLVSSIEPQSSINAELLDICERSFREWLFLPCLEEGRPVSSRVKIPVQF